MNKTVVEDGLQLEMSDSRTDRGIATLASFRARSLSHGHVPHHEALSDAPAPGRLLGAGFPLTRQLLRTAA